MGVFVIHGDITRCKADALLDMIHARFLFLVLACAGCKDRPVSDERARAPQIVVDQKTDAAMPTGQPHTIQVSALAPWTSIAPAVLEDTFSTGDRMTSRHNVFEPGGFRLTYVRAKNPESIGRVEYVFRDRTLQEVSGRLVEAAQRFGFAQTFDDVIAKASKIPADLTGLDIYDRMVTQEIDWAPQWRGFVKIYAESGPNVGDTRRIQWMVELRAFQPDFRAASDP